MKKFLLFSLVLAAAVACQHEEPSPEAKANPGPAADYPQTWQLVQLTGSIPGYVKTGADLPWQETYVFHADSTFLKTRRQGSQRVEARGTFSLQRFPDGRYAVLTYAAASSIIGSCTASRLKETLALKSDNTLVSTWQACDGPGLEYKKVN
jgi:hypothetical protein